MDLLTLGFHYLRDDQWVSVCGVCVCVMDMMGQSYKVMHDFTSIHGHRTLKTPHPVRSAQLTRVPPS